MTADGVWTYTLDNTNCDVQALNVCDKLTDCFTVTTIDGTPQVLTITINGANDAAVIFGGTSGSVTEAGACTYGTPIATGSLTDTDVDNTPNTFTAVCAPKASDAGYGAFTMTADGVWTYKLDNANCAVQALNDCDTLTDCFKVTTIDGTAQVVTIIINGADDAFHFKDKTSDLITSDAIDLAEDIPGSISFPKNDAGASGPPATSVEVQTIEMSAQWSDTSVWNQPDNEVTTRAPHDLIV
jgi:VCBS repeat-containing protein